MSKTLDKELEAEKYLIEVDDYGDMCNYIANNQIAYHLIKQTLIRNKQIQQIIDDWARGKYGFSEGANTLYLREIKKILEED